MDYTRHVPHMTPADAQLHQEIMETKELLLTIDKHTVRSIRVPIRTKLQDLRTRQYERFGEQWDSGMTLGEIAKYWNRTSQFIIHELHQMGKR